MAAKIRESLPHSEIELISGGGGDFIVKTNGQVLWNKNKQGGQFPDEADLLTKLRGSST